MLVHVTGFLRLWLFLCFIDKSFCWFLGCCCSKAAGSSAGCPKIWSIVLPSLSSSSIVFGMCHSHLAGPQVFTTVVTFLLFLPSLVLMKFITNTCYVPITHHLPFISRKGVSWLSECFMWIISRLSCNWHCYTLFISVGLVLYRIPYDLLYRLQL